MHPPPGRDGTRKSEVGTRNSILFVPLGGHTAGRILKRIGVGLSLATLLLWAASVGRVWWIAMGPVNLSIGGGIVILEIFEAPSIRPGAVPAVTFGLVRPSLSYREPLGGVTSTLAVIPFWFPLLLAAIPTAWLWHRDRRLISSSPDHRLCLRCGYDLTGNTSGVCPECGKKTAIANGK